MTYFFISGWEGSAFLFLPWGQGKGGGGPLSCSVQKKKKKGEGFFRRTGEGEDTDFFSWKRDKRGETVALHQ